MTANEGQSDGLDDLRLLELQAATVFVLDNDGSILALNDPRRGPGPLFALSGCPAGNVLRIHHSVPEPVSRELQELVRTEPPFHGRDATPIHVDRYLRLLGRRTPVEPSALGWIWTLVSGVAIDSTAIIVRSGTPDGDQLLARMESKGMPEALVAMGFDSVAELWPPWCVVFDGPEIASIAFAARIGTAAAEIGVATMPAFRGRGHAATATAAWAAHPALGSRPRFYSTDRANRSSRRVTERLDLRYVGSRLVIP